MFLKKDQHGHYTEPPTARDAFWPMSDLTSYTGISRKYRLLSWQSDGWLCLWMVFVGHGFTSGGQESRSAVMCKIRASKCYTESLPFMPKDKRSCFSKGERFTVQLSLDRAFALRK